MIIYDANIKTETQAQERADYELSINKDPPLVGDVIAFGLPTLQPGEKIQISDPLSNLNPDYYKILKYKHEFRGIMKTMLTIEKEPRQIHHLIKDRIGAEQKLSEMPNPNEMRYSWIDTFDADSGIHSDESTKITDGVLKTDGGASGTWISDNKALSSDAIAYELRVNGDVLAGTTYYVSSDGGSTWQSVAALNTAYDMSPPGSNLKIKVVLSSASTQIKSLSLMYKT
jgi:hypothetical protein